MYRLKRVISIAVAVAILMMSVVGMEAFAEEETDIGVAVEQSDDGKNETEQADVLQEMETEQADVQREADVVAAGTEAREEDEQEIESQIITGLEEYDIYAGKSLDSFVAQKGEKEKIKQQFPTTLSGYIENKSGVVEIPVKWVPYMSNDEAELGLFLYQAEPQDGYQWSDDLKAEFYHNQGTIPYIEVKVEEKDDTGIMLFSTNPTALKAWVTYSANFQTYGMKYGENDGYVGTEGESKRMESLNMTIRGDGNVGVMYRGYVQDTGWTGWYSNGGDCGTIGQSKRLEVIEIKLYGAHAADYALQVHAHCQTVGWQIKTATGTNTISFGTVGKRIEGIAANIVPVFTGKTGYHRTNCSGCISYTCVAPVMSWHGEGSGDVVCPETNSRYAPAVCGACQSVGVHALMYMIATDYHWRCIHQGGWVYCGYDVTGYCTRNGGWGNHNIGGQRDGNHTHTYTRCPGHNTANTYTVYYNGNGATGGSTAASGHSYDTGRNLTANGFSRNGYVFAGWATSPGGGVIYGNGARVSNLTASNGGSVTLYAVWTPLYTLDVNGSYNGTVQGNTLGLLTFDVYLNGGLVTNDVTDYYNANLAAGTTYNITDIRPVSGKKYTGASGTLSGTIRSNTSAVLNTISTHTNTISHWMGGFKNGEGNNGNRTYFKISDTTFQADYNGTYTMDAGRGVQIPKGYELQQTFQSNISGAWSAYSFGTKMTQKAANMNCEYYYQPKSYSITYNLNGGKNHPENPMNYNILYGVSLQNPTRQGYTFEGWYNGNTKISGINTGANAIFSSVSDMYNKLNARTTGNIMLNAKWERSTTALRVEKQIDAESLKPEHGDTVFIYRLEGTDKEGNKHTYYQELVFPTETQTGGVISKSVIFENIPLGQYTLTEEETGRYYTPEIEAEPPLAEHNGVVTCNLMQETEQGEPVKVVFKGEKYEWQWFSSVDCL